MIKAANPSEVLSRLIEVAKSTAAARRSRTIERYTGILSTLALFLLVAVIYVPMFLPKPVVAVPSDPDGAIRCMIAGICYSPGPIEATHEGGNLEGMLSSADIHNSSGTPLELQPAVLIEPVNPLTTSACLLGGHCTAKEPAADSLRDDEGFERLSPKGSVCAAASNYRSLPGNLRQQLISTSERSEIRTCSKAVNNLAQLGALAQLVAETNGATVTSGRLLEAASFYVQSCLSDSVLQNRGDVSSADQQFLRKHVGVIMLRRSLHWDDAQPICHAARLGRLVITAQHCIPSNSGAYVAGAGRTPEIGFRFFDNAIVHTLSLRMLGTKKGYVEERNRDFAILQIQNLPSNLGEDVSSLVGNMELFADSYNLTSNLYHRIVSAARGAADLQRTAKIEHSLLCRPAHIAANGIFLHACQTVSGVSGAPLFQRQNGKLVFVGIHNGVTSALDEPKLASCKVGLPNYGIAIPPEIITGISPR